MPQTGKHINILEQANILTLIHNFNTLYSVQVCLATYYLMAWTIVNGHQTTIVDTEATIVRDRNSKLSFCTFSPLDETC